MTKGSGQSGYVVVTTLVFSGVFLLILYSLLGLVFSQYERQRQIHRSTESLQIAEAGLDWYRWYLAHNPGDITGPDGSMPYEKTITDPERGDVGTAELDVSGSSYCGQNQWVDIESTGWSNKNTDVTRTVRARYLRPSVARFSYILNSNVWAGGDRDISGPYHSNGGIQMDASHNSTVSSAREDWTCTGGPDCDPSGETKPGVFGDGSDPELWDFPVPQVDFAGITLDLDTIRETAKNQGTFFSGNQGNASGGYHIIFNGDQTIDVYEVERIDEIWGQSDERGWHRNQHAIVDERFDGTYTLSDQCPVIFSSEKLWLEGDISNKITVAAAKTKNPNFSADIVINDDIEYQKEKGAGLTAISENSVHIPLLSPDNMTIDGIFVAQNGRFGRDHYERFYTSPIRWGYVDRDQLNITGSIVSNGSVGTQWVDNDGNRISGYADRTNTFDRDQAVQPPPFTPFVTEEYELVRWQEVRD
jgi:hypothetical protein